MDVFILDLTELKMMMVIMIKMIMMMKGKGLSAAPCLTLPLSLIPMLSDQAVYQHTVCGCLSSYLTGANQCDVTAA